MLEPTTNMLGSPMLVRLFEDIFQDKMASVGGLTEGFGGSRVEGLITGETLDGKDEMKVKGRGKWVPATLR